MANQTVVITVGVVNSRGRVAFKEWLPCGMDERSRDRVALMLLPVRCIMAASLNFHSSRIHAMISLLFQSIA